MQDQGERWTFQLQLFLLFGKMQINKSWRGLTGWEERDWIIWFERPDQ